MPSISSSASALLVTETVWCACMDLQQVTIIILDTTNKCLRLGDSCVDIRHEPMKAWKVLLTDSHEEIFMTLVDCLIQVGIEFSFFVVTLRPIVQGCMGLHSNNQLSRVAHKIV